MVMSARIPLKTKLALSDVDLRKLLENIAELRECGAIEVVNNENNDKSNTLINLLNVL